MVYFLYYKFTYEIKGEVFEDVSDTTVKNKVESLKKISDVAVSVLCPGKSRRVQRAKSDSNGSYIVKGEGAVEDCELIFDHLNYKREVIKLGKEYRKEDAFLYEVNVEMVPINRK